MRENRPSGSEGGVAFGPSLPLSGPFVNPPCDWSDWSDEKGFSQVEQPPKHAKLWPGRGVDLRGAYRAMNIEPRVISQADPRASGGPVSNLIFKGLIIFLAGVVFGMGAFQTGTHWREQSRFKLARQKAELLFAQTAPRLEVQLAVALRLLEGLQEELSQAGSANSPTEIRLKYYAARHRQIESELEKADQGLRLLNGLADQPPAGLRLAVGESVLPPEQQSKVAALQAQYEAACRGLRVAASAADWVKEHQQQLLLAQSGGPGATTPTELPAASGGQAVQAAATAPSPTGLAAQLVSLEAVQRMAEVAERAQNDSMQRSYLDVIQRLAPPAGPVLIRAHPAYFCAEPPLVIGQSYPDRYLGYRVPYNYSPRYFGHNYVPGYYGYGRLNRCSYRR